MVTLNLKTKYKTPSRIFKSVCGLMAWMVWVLIFFTATFKGNFSHSAIIKATKSIVASTHNKAHLPSNNSDPLQLPEESEVFISEIDDESGDYKKNAYVISFVQLLTLQQITEIQLVQSFQYHQSRQQITAIPLFVLHHSWKGHLV